jgi:co-chaperonin GroES (HSP10)
MKEIDELVLLGDGVLVKKPIIQNKIGSLHLPEGAAEALLPMHECEVVAVGPGDQKPMGVQVGDIAFLPKTQQYAEVQFDGQTHFIITQYNILFVKRKNKE